MTGSPKSAGFKTKATFFEKLSEYGDFEEIKAISKKNLADILVTNTPDSETKKMQDARDLGVEILTYEDMKETFELEADE